MKKANIYEVSVKDKSVKGGRTQITCVATNLLEAVGAAAPCVWNKDTQQSEYIKYKESDIIEIKLIESGVNVQNYIPDYEEEEK